VERVLQQPLRRRKAVAGLVAAGLSALLAAYYADSRVHSSSLDEPTLFRHLLRRAGFGLAPNEVTTWQGLGWNEAVDRLVNYEQVANHDLEALLAQYHFDLTTPNGIRLWWLVRMAYTARPLEEKMTLFWHGLLTSSLGKATPSEMIRQNQFFREHALDNYGVILKGISRDVAMMRWLDLAENRVGHPNENYARELMELFTMGPLPDSSSAKTAMTTSRPSSLHSMIAVPKPFWGAPEILARMILLTSSLSNLPLLLSLRRNSCASLSRQRHPQSLCNELQRRSKRQIIQSRRQ